MSEAPEPDRISGAPHPRETRQVFGHAPAEAGFLDAFNAGRLHSGWLITGPAGVGKATLAYRLAAFLLSRPPAGGLFGDPGPVASLDLSDDDADLRLIRAGAHPRLFVLKRGLDDKGERLKSQITVDEARKLKEFFQLSAADGGRRAVIVDAADELNPNAANAILKALEEPPEATTLFLIAHQPARLLPTIRSRCRVLRLAPLGPADLDAALAAATEEPTDPALAVLAGGSVGAALHLSQGGGDALYAELIGLLQGLPRLDQLAAVKLSESMAGRPSDPRFGQMLDLVDLFLSRAARAGLMGPPAAEAAPGEAALLARIAPHDRAARIWADLAQQIQSRARAGKAVNLDPASLMLDMLLRIEETAGGLAAA